MTTILPYKGRTTTDSGMVYAPYIPRPSAYKITAIHKRELVNLWVIDFLFEGSLFKSSVYDEIIEWIETNTTGGYWFENTDSPRFQAYFVNRDDMTLTWMRWS